MISVQLGSDLRVLDQVAMSKLRTELELLLLLWWWWWNGSCCCCCCGGGGREMESKKLEDDRESNMAEEESGGDSPPPRGLFIIATEIASARESNSSSPLDDCKLPLFPESITTLFFLFFPSLKERKKEREKKARRIT